MKFYASAAIAIVVCLSLIGCKKEEPQTGGYGVPEKNAAPSMKEMREKNQEQMEKEKNREKERMEQEKNKSSSSIQNSKKRWDMYQDNYSR